ncbi:hypothetical protein ES704_01770 [subsurface metagenome]|jgi:SAM-dependent methyltransferase
MSEKNLGDMSRREIYKEIYKFNFHFDLKHILSGFDYERVHEVPEVLRSLGIDRDKDLKMKILDVACGTSVYPCFIASRGHQVYAADLNPVDIKWQEKMSRKFGFEIKTSVQDCSNLSYPDCFFDRVYSISSIEHFRGDNMDGDIIAMKQIGRILRPGGLAVISVPFTAHYRENIDTKNYIGNFSRYYNKENLNSRLIEPSGLTLKNMKILGEKEYAFSKSWFLKYFFRCVPGIVRTPFTSLFVIPATLYVSEIKEDEIKPDRDYTAIITLVKDKVIAK